MSMSARSAVPLPNRLLSPGCVVSSAAVVPSRPGPVIVARFDANACRLNPQSVGELANSQDQLAPGEIWALAGGGGANTKIAAATTVGRNSFIGFPPCRWIATYFRRATTTTQHDKDVVGSRPKRTVITSAKRPQ